MTTSETIEPPESRASAGTACWASWNLNDVVRFRMTDKGRKHIDAINSTDPIYSRYPLRFEPDVDGWIETQLWNFANIFGPTFGIGFDQTVETQIELRSCL